MTALAASGQVAAADLSGSGRSPDPDVLAGLRPIVVGVSTEFFCPGYERSDLIQEGWVGALTALRAYDGRGTLHGFVRLCVRRQLIDLIGVNQSERKRALNSSVGADPLLTLADQRTVELIVETRERLRLLVDGRMKLCGAQRIAFDRYINGAPITTKQDENARYLALGKLRAAACP